MKTVYVEPPLLSSLYYNKTLNELIAWARQIACMELSAEQEN